MLGGTPEAPRPDTPPAPPPGYYPPPGSPYAGYPAPPVAPNQPGAYYPPPGYPYAPPGQPAFAPGPAPAAPTPEPPGTPFPEFDPSALGGDDNDDKTRFLGGVDIAKLRFPKIAYTLQIMDTAGRWHDWGAVHASGINVGRSKSSAEFPGLNSMAVKHMRLSYNKAGLLVEDLGSINGVYLRISKPVELIDGMRFRIGLQTLEFHQAEPFEPLAPIVGEDGEEFCSNDLGPLAFVDLIRPNGRPGLRIPLTRVDATIVGREGPQAHIMLAGDHSVSGVHAQVRHEQGQFFLEDLKSRNGTFIHVLGSAPLHPGDEILAGRVKFRVVNQAAG